LDTGAHAAPTTTPLSDAHNQTTVKGLYTTGDLMRGSTSLS
jgi:hypothetical protein